MGPNGSTPRLWKNADDETVDDAPKIGFADLHGQAGIIFVSSEHDLRLALKTHFDFFDLWFGSSVRRPFRPQVKLTKHAVRTRFR